MGFAGTAGPALRHVEDDIEMVAEVLGEVRPIVQFSDTVTQRLKCAAHSIDCGAILDVGVRVLRRIKLPWIPGFQVEGQADSGHRVGSSTDDPATGSALPVQTTGRRALACRAGTDGAESVYVSLPQRLATQCYLVAGPWGRTQATGTRRARRTQIMGRNAVQPGAASHLTNKSTLCSSLGESRLPSSDGADGGTSDSGRRPTPAAV